MFLKKYSKKEKMFLKRNLKKLREYLKNKVVKEKDNENKLINKFMDYKISKKDQDKINKLKLLKNKKRKEQLYFKITELGEKNKDFYNEETLFEYTKKNWQFQKDAMIESAIDQLDWQIKKDFPKITEESQKYKEIYDKRVNKIKEDTIKSFGEFYNKFYSYGSWCRWVENDRLVYGSIQSVESYYLDKINDICDQIIDDLIPSCFTNVPGKEFTSSTTCKKCSTWNIETRANGREKELEGLKNKIYLFQNKFIKETLLSVVNPLDGKTFKEVDCQNNDCITNIYIPNINTSKKIRTNNFLEDVYKMEQPFKILEQQIKKIIKKEKLKKRIKQIYNKNKKEFDI